MIDYYNFLPTYLVLSCHQHHHTVFMRNLITQGITSATPHPMYQNEAKNSTENIYQLGLVANQKLWALQYFSKSHLKVASG